MDKSNFFPIFGLIVLIIFIIVLSVLIYITYKQSFTSDSGIPYKVINGRKNKYQAVKILDRLNTESLLLIEKIHNKYKNSGKTELVQSLNLIMINYNPDLLVENDPIFTYGNKTFAADQKRISICIRKNNGDFYDYNILFFAFLHELSHIGTPMDHVYSENDKHPTYFWELFKFLLKEAIEDGLLVPEYYSETNFVNYCGVDIKHNPYYDNTIKDL